MSAPATGAGILPGSRLDLREVSGPSSVAGGRRRFMSLLWVTATTNFRLSFHGTALGYVWSLARPLFLFGVLLAVFTQVFKLGLAVESYPAMLLLDIMLFTLFAEATGKAVASVLGNEGIVRKTQFPRLVIPMSVVLTEVFNFALNMVVVFAFILVYGVEPRWTWLLLPIVVLLLIGITLAVSMLLSALFPRFRDVALIWGVAGTALFYATPVLYPITLLQESPTLQKIVQLNPLTPIFELAQTWIIADPNGNTPGPIDATRGLEWILAASIVIYIGICVLSVWVFNREASRIAEEL